MLAGLAERELCELVPRAGCGRGEFGREGEGVLGWGLGLVLSRTSSSWVRRRSAGKVGGG